MRLTGDVPPRPEIVHEGRKHVDWYYDRKRMKWIARGWPNMTKQKQTPRTKAAAKKFGFMAHLMSLVEGTELNDVIAMAKEDGQSKRDYLMRKAYGSLIHWDTQLPHIPDPGMITSMEPMLCSSRPVLYMHQVVPTLVKTAYSLVKPSRAGIEKFFLGQSRECGFIWNFVEANETSGTIATDLLEGIYILPPIAEGVLMYTWLFGLVGNVATSFSSAVHVNAGCHMLATHGTCIVGGNTFQPFTYNGDYIDVNANTTIQDPGGWSGVPGATVRLPIDGNYRAMYSVCYSGFRVPIDVVRCASRLQVSPTPGQLFADRQGPTVAGAEHATLVGMEDFHALAGQAVTVQISQQEPGFIANICDVLLTVGSAD